MSAALDAKSVDAAAACARQRHFYRQIAAHHAGAARRRAASPQTPFTSGRGPLSHTPYSETGYPGDRHHAETISRIAAKHATRTPRPRRGPGLWLARTGNYRLVLARKKSPNPIWAPCGFGTEVAISRDAGSPARKGRLSAQLRPVIDWRVSGGSAPRKPPFPRRRSNRRNRPEAAIRVPYSITSSAPARIAGGIVRPSAFAVLRLITSSNFVGCSIGRSAGLAPLRILST